MEQKHYLQSKRFWGMVASLAGFVAITVAGYFGQDVGEYVKIFGQLLSVFGIPFTFYGGAVAKQPLGFSKK